MYASRITISSILGIIVVLLVQISLCRSLPLHRHIHGRYHERRQMSPVKILERSLNGVLDDAEKVQYNIVSEIVFLIFYMI